MINAHIRSLLVIFIFFPLWGMAQKTSSPPKADLEKLSILLKKVERMGVQSADSLDFYAQQGITMAMQLGQFQKVVQFKRLIGLRAFQESNYKKALENFLSAIRLAEQHPPDTAYIHVLYDASEVYRKINRDTSMNFIRRGLSLAQQLNEKNFIADGFNRLGYAFEIRDKNDSAFYYYKKGLEMNRIVGNKTGLSYAYESLAGLANKAQRHTEALRYLQESYQLRQNVGDKFAMAISLINIGETYKAMNQADSAIAYGRKALKLSSAITFLDLEAYSNEFIASIYKEKGDYSKALQYKEQQYSIRDSIFNMGKAKQIAELDRKYQTEKHQQQIRLLSQSATINRLKVKERNFLLLILGVLMLAGSAMAYFIFTRRQLRAKNELQAMMLHQQDLAARAVLEAEERERRRIAGDLHDGVGQMLSAALLNLNVLFNRLALDDTHRQQAGQALALVNDSYDEMRSISHQMMPNALIKAGLASALREFLQKIDQGVLKINLEVVGLGERLDTPTETVIYRVIQEVVNNVIKHAGASKLDIALLRDEEGVSISIEDNGRGFDKDSVDLTSGIGMANILSRVHFLKGTVDIDTAPGKGTLVAIYLPGTHKPALS